MADFKEYDKHGIYLAYPENWILLEEAMETAEGSLTLNSPQGAFWLLRQHPVGTGLREIAGEVLKMMQEEYEEIEFEELEEQSFGIDIFGYEMNFFYQDWTSTAKVRCFSHENRVLAVFWQTGDRMMIMAGEDPLPSEKVLEAISFSLLRELGSV